MTEGAQDARYGSPLRSATRKERTWLLAVSVIGVLLGYAGLLPTRIQAFGLELQPMDRRWLLISCAALILYFLVGFTIHALTDWLAYEAELHRQWEAEDRPAAEVITELEKEELARQGPLDKLVEPMRRAKRNRNFRLILQSIHVQRAHLGFDLVLPLVVGGAALVLVVARAFVR